MNSYLSFSDSAKYAEVAKNISLGLGKVVHHSFFDPNLLGSSFFPANFPPLTPLILAAIFRIFPATDLTVIWAGHVLFALIVFGILAITKKIYSPQAALIAAILFAFNTYFWEYTRNFTTELVFACLLVLFVLLYLKRGVVRFLYLLPLFLMFFVRQQTILIAAALTLTEIIHSPYRVKYSILAAVFLIGMLLFVKAVPNSPLSPFSVLGSLHISTDVSQAVYLRGVEYESISPKQLLSKTFYNLYNFVKFPERIISPLVLVSFIYGLFKAQPSYQVRKLFTLTLISLGLFLLAASATLPNARYIHPLLPLISICGAIGLAEISNSLKKFTKLFAAILLGIIILPPLGFLTLDARYRGRQFNLNQPPAYYQISAEMAKIIPKNELIVTNLDAWAAWYHGLTTMWFPAEPEMLSRRPPKYIVITNYLEHDADFSLGPWHDVVYNPAHIQNQFLSQNYRILNTFTIDRKAVYQNQTYQGTILILKP